MYFNLFLSRVTNSRVSEFGAEKAVCLPKCRAREDPLAAVVDVVDASTGVFVDSWAIVCGRSWIGRRHRLGG